MIRVPNRLGLLMLGLGGIFGMRTPPDPDVIAQMAPARGAEGSAEPPDPGAAAEPIRRDVPVDRRQDTRSIRPRTRRR